MSCSDVFDLLGTAQATSAAEWRYVATMSNPPCWRDGTQEIDHFECMLLRGVEEVETVLDFRDADRVLVGIVLQNQLLEVQERPLVVDLLANLNQRAPGVLGGEPSAFRALRTLNDVFDFEYLLQDG